LHGLNGSGRSPAGWTPERFAGLDAMPQTGWDSITVPGVVEAWARLSNRFGRLSFSELFQPAIGYAREGFQVGPITAMRWREAADAYSAFDEFRRAFLIGGKAPSAGQRFCCPDQAETLARIADSGGDDFYRGELAARIDAASVSDGGALSLKDLQTHKSQWVDPISVTYRGVRLHEMPPNGQGLAALIALGILERFDMRRFAPDSADSLHLQLEAMKCAFGVAFEHIADPEWMQTNPSLFLSDKFLDEQAQCIRMDRAATFAPAPPDRGGTVYLAAADAEGCMVSLIQSNYLGFGSGIVIPGTGISMQNRGHGFVLAEGHPNCVAGAKRPYHTIIPAFVTWAGRPLMSFGVMGGHMQPQGHVQMMVRLFDYRQNPQTACDAPRWMVDQNSSIALEPGYRTAVREDLVKRGHRLVDDVPTYQFGGAQAIYRLDEGYCAASDPRKEGQAVGF
jgi:gamma-glutamyltranspeptidase/glutathione hydrolase